MPRKTSIQYEDFYAKANAMQELYGRVTYERIREHLGSGSMSTIQNYMDQWKREQIDSTVKGVPKILTDRIDIVVRDVYQQISSITEEEKQKSVTRIQETLEQERYRADRADAHAMECTERLLAQDKLLKVKDRASKKQGEQVTRLKAEVQAAKAELRNKRDELKSLQKSMDNLQRQHDRQLTRLENQYQAISRSLSELAAAQRSK